MHAVMQSNRAHRGGRSATFKDDGRPGEKSGEWREIHRAKSKRGHAEGKEKGASIHPSLRGRILGTAPQETPHVRGPIAPSCALRAHAQQRPEPQPEPARGTGRRLVLRPAGAPTHCACSVRVVLRRNGHCTACSQLGSWRCTRYAGTHTSARASDRNRSEHASARVHVTDQANKYTPSVP
jgi:hypothetical protein